MLTRGLAGLVLVALAGCRKDAPPPTAPLATTSQPISAPVEEQAEDSQAGEDLDELDETEAPEKAAPPLVEQGPITFRLHNLCSKPVSYGVAPLQGELELDDPKTIKAGAVEEITAQYGLGIHLIAQGTHSAAATDTDGGHVWISSSCRGVGASDDPNADPVKIDRDLREKIERMRKAVEQADAPASKPPTDDGSGSEQDDEDDASKT